MRVSRLINFVYFVKDAIAFTHGFTQEISEEDIARLEQVLPESERQANHLRLNLRLQRWG